VLWFGELYLSGFRVYQDFARSRSTLANGAPMGESLATGSECGLTTVGSGMQQSGSCEANVEIY